MYSSFLATFSWKQILLDDVILIYIRSQKTFIFEKAKNTLQSGKKSS